MRIVATLVGLAACAEPLAELAPAPDQPPDLSSDPSRRDIVRPDRPTPPTPPTPPGEPPLEPGDIIFEGMTGYDWNAKAATTNALVMAFAWSPGHIFGDLMFGNSMVGVSRVQAIAETDLANVTATTCTSLSYPAPSLPYPTGVPISDGAILCVKTATGGYAAVQQIWHYVPAQWYDEAALRIKHLVEPPPPPPPPQPTQDLVLMHGEGYDWNTGEVLPRGNDADFLRMTFQWLPGYWGPGSSDPAGIIVGAIELSDVSYSLASKVAVISQTDLDSVTAGDCAQANKNWVNAIDGQIVCVKRAQGGVAAVKVISHASSPVESGTIRIKVLE